MVKGVSAKRHAQAVFQIARESNQLEKWQSDLDVIAEVLENTELVTLLENPKLQYKQKEKILQNILTDVNPTAMNLANFLVSKNRVGIIRDLVTEFTRLVNMYHGINTTKVVTAIPLSDEETDSVRKKLATFTGKELVVTTQVDPSIMGGIVAKVGDQLIDGSVRSRLKDLRKSLIEAGLEVR